MLNEHKKHVKDLRNFIKEVQANVEYDAEKLNSLKKLSYECLSCNRKLEFDKESTLINWTMLNDYLSITGFEDLGFNEFADKAGLEAFLNTKLFHYLTKVNHDLGEFLRQELMNGNPEKKNKFYELLKKNEHIYQKLNELDYNAFLSKQNIILYDFNIKLNKHSENAFSLYESFTEFFSEFIKGLKDYKFNLSLEDLFISNIEKSFPEKSGELINLLENFKMIYCKFYRFVNASNAMISKHFNRFKISDDVQISDDNQLSDDVKHLYS